MNPLNTQEIAVDKRKVLMWLVILTALGIIGYLIFQNIDIDRNTRTSNRIVGGAIGLMGASVLLGPFYIYKLFATKPGFIISDEGITDNSSMTPHGFVPWEEVAQFGTTNLGFRKCITVTLINPEKHIENASGWYKRVSWRSVYKRYGVSMLITSAILQCSNDELLNMLNQGLETYAKRK